MTKSELIAELAASAPHLRQEDLELIVATVFDQITGALARGERVELRGFGAFTVKQRNARTGRNPRGAGSAQLGIRANSGGRPLIRIRGLRRPSAFRTGWSHRQPAGARVSVVSASGRDAAETPPALRDHDNHGQAYEQRDQRGQGS